MLTRGTIGVLAVALALVPASAAGATLSSAPAAARSDMVATGSAAATRSAAAATRSDEAATHSYLLARLEQRSEQDHSPSSELEAIRALAARLRSECPGILTGTPLAPVEGGDSEAEADLRLEIADAAFGAAEELGHATDVRFYDRVERLHWHKRKLTKLLHDLALEADLQSGLPQPGLCADIRFWVASGYKAVSPATVQSRREHDKVSATATIEVGPGEHNLKGAEAVVAYRLRPYENAADRKLAKRVFPPADELKTPAAEKALKVLFAAIEEVFVALGKSVSG